MHLEGDWGDLQTRGFVVARDLLSPADVAGILGPYLESQGEERGFVPAFMLGPAGAKVIQDLQRHLLGVLPAIEERSGLHLTAFDPFVAYFPNQPGRWHTDEPPYWMFQDLRQYVNCWIPLLKPKPNESGLCVVPLDALKEKDPAMFEALHGAGGAAFAPTSAIEQGSAGLADFLYGPSSPNPASPSDHLLVDRVEGFVDLKPKIDIDDIAVTPDLQAGDAIFCRGDVLHKTQTPAKADRVAISIRVVNGDMRVTKNFFLERSEFTRRLMANPDSPFVGALLGAFAFHGKDSLSVHEVVDFLNANRSGEPAQREAVVRVKAKLMETLGVTSYGPLV